jgi:hypothetical protein
MTQNTACACNENNFDTYSGDSGFSNCNFAYPDGVRFNNEAKGTTMHKDGNGTLSLIPALVLSIPALILKVLSPALTVNVVPSALSYTQHTMLSIPLPQTSCKPSVLPL